MGLAGLVFLGLLVWLLRKVLRAARTERDLEGERLSGALADELRAAKAIAAASTAPGPRLVIPEPASVEPLGPLDGADVRGATAEHLQVIESQALEREASLRLSHKGESDVPRRIEVLWAKSTATHAVWCERRHAATLAAAAMTREVICVVRVENGKPGERWSY
ncbi:MAG TPA: hypothetical protein VH083_10425 [Myxococcales bacterium]|jgi:hypothetical protein|nr:hypothetical protein [Myxococcales bacterium]